MDIGINCPGTHLQEFLGLLVDGSCVLKPKGDVDVFADGSHCTVESLDLAADIPTYELLELHHSFLQSCGLDVL